MRREIDQYRYEEEKPFTKINYNYNMQVSSNKDFKGKTIEKPYKTISAPGFFFIKK